MHQFLILGGDQRQAYLSQILEQEGHAVVSPVPLEDAMASCDIIICPVPFTKDGKTIFSTNSAEKLQITSFIGLLSQGHTLFGGNVPSSVAEYCAANHIPCFDFMKIDAVAWKNAVATAEGAVAEAVFLNPVNLHKSRCLVTGWGRCAQTLAAKLKGLDAHVTVSCRNRDKLAQASALGYDAVELNALGENLRRYEFIFNTIPAPVFDGPLVERMHPQAAVIDIASAPGGVDFNACEKAGIRAKLCPGLPGRCAPKASAMILYEAIMDCL